MSGSTVFPATTPMAVDVNPQENSEETEKKPVESQVNQELPSTPSEEDQLLAANILTTIRGPQTDSHLETLASAALLEISDQSNTPLPPPPPQKSVSSKNLHDAADDGKWQTVGFFKGLSHTVTDFVDHSSWNTSMIEDINADSIPDLSLSTRVQLEPGVTYRFRLAAINSRGHGPWNEFACFKTCLPGFPGAPSAIKISKSPEGAYLSWESPPAQIGEIFEYSVYLAVKSLNTRERVPPAQLAFVRVFCGANNQCIVQNAQLQNAHVDCSNKPAIIFRIAARNDKGYGPATQVRWLQGKILSSKVFILKF
ncbi:HCFC2.2 family protein [Megaselia abdita]